MKFFVLWVGTNECADEPCCRATCTCKDIFPNVVSAHQEAPAFAFFLLLTHYSPVGYKYAYIDCTNPSMISFFLRGVRPRRLPSRQAAGDRAGSSSTSQQHRATSPTPHKQGCKAAQQPPRGGGEATDGGRSGGGVEDEAAAAAAGGAKMVEDELADCDDELQQVFQQAVFFFFFIGMCITLILLPIGFAYHMA